SPGARTRPRKGPPGRALIPACDMGRNEPRGQAQGPRGFPFDSGDCAWQGSRLLKTPLEVAALANPELGAKQICPNCSTKFYDLTRRPAHCPKCDTEFDPEEALRNRRVRARTVLPEDDVEETKVEAEAADEDGFEAETE